MVDNVVFSRFVFWKKIHGLDQGRPDLYLHSRTGFRYNILRILKLFMGSSDMSAGLVLIVSRRRYDSPGISGGNIKGGTVPQLLGAPPNWDSFSAKKG